jgi:hypothetical protein
MARVFSGLNVHRAFLLFFLLLGGLAVSGRAQPARLLVDLLQDGGYPGFPFGAENEPTFKFATVQGKSFFWALRWPPPAGAEFRAECRR